MPAWLRHYRARLLGGDLLAAGVVTVMLVPQSLAYAMLAGLPPQMGLYASLLPLVAYAWFGSSMTLSVGPVASASLITASALAPLAVPGSAHYAHLATLLALLAGLFLLAFGLLRLGMLSHFLSHPVMGGFVSGSAVVILVGQLKPLLGLHFDSRGVADTLIGVASHLQAIQTPSAGVGGVSLVILLLAQGPLPAALVRLGMKASHAGLVVKLVPMAVVLLATLWVATHELAIPVVGAVPAGLPQAVLALPSLAEMSVLWLPALLIAVVGSVESMSVAQTLAARRGERIHPDAELIGLGAANAASALCGGYPVTGGLARSVVNFSAGAHTPLAGVICALLMALVLLFATGWFIHLPHAVLAATVIAAVSGLIDVSFLRRAWRIDRGDALTWLATFLGVLVLRVEQGLLAGVIVSFAVLVWRASRPHMAVVGRVPGTEHFRNIERHRVDTLPHVLAVRIDENLFFGNAHAVEARIEALLRQAPATRHLLLILSAVNRIDLTALSMLSALAGRLDEQNIQLALCEVKGPVMERLQHTEFLRGLQQRIWLSTHAAFIALEKAP
jgi:SulP family sulfate permease